MLSELEHFSTSFMPAYILIHLYVRLNQFEQKLDFLHGYAKF